MTLRNTVALGLAVNSTGMDGRALVIQAKLTGLGFRV